MEIIDNTIDEFLNLLLENTENIYGEDELTKFSECFFSQFDELIIDAKEKLFDKLPINELQDQKINDISLLLFTTDWLSRTYSGIVFAGYGEKELLPACVSYHVEHLICGHLKYRIDQNASIDFSGSSAMVLAFAQDDVVQNIFSWRHPTYLRVLAEEVSNSMNKKDSEELLERIETEMYRTYTRPILATVSSFPKDDLALIAETIINLTSFMRRVSMELETVGGPVDVAVISKKDGFIWINRKHYFDINYNLHFRSGN